MNAIFKLTDVDKLLLVPELINANIVEVSNMTTGYLFNLSGDEMPLYDLIIDGKKIGQITLELYEWLLKNEFILKGGVK